MKTLDFLAVDIDGKELNDKIKLKSGGELWIDPMFRPEHHRKFSGAVAAECLKLPELKVGDTAYWMYTLTSKENMHVVNGKLLLWIHTSAVFAYVRDGKINLLQDYLLVTPQEVSEGIDEELSKKIAGLGLSVPDQFAETKKKSEVFGTIAHAFDESFVGKPIAFHNREAFENDIEGTSYYLMKAYDDGVYPLDDEMIKQVAKNGEKK